MHIATKENIKEIAEQLDCGFRAFIHKTTGQLIFVPDENNLTSIDLDPWDEEFKVLENNNHDFYEVERWTSSEAFDVMSEFAEQLGDRSLQNRLFEALRRQKPFREFKFVIDNAGDFRQEWFDFKNNWQQQYVAKELQRINMKAIE
jgi:hypothetical protein